MAHQWFGNSVTPATWQDIWLNEGIATWIVWLWESKRSRPVTLEERFNLNYNRAIYPGTVKAKQYWNPPPGRPTKRTMFDSTIYTRGAMTIQALYDKIGSGALFEILRRWVRQYKYDVATTNDFIALSEEVSGVELTGFFRAWLYDHGRPLVW